MKIYYHDEALRNIHVDRERLTAFLLEQGVSPEDVKRLCIRFQQIYHKEHPDFPAEQIYGMYNNRCSAYVFTHKDATPSRLNQTLLHEIRHFQKRGYQPGEAQLPYLERPSEIDARTFAAQHADLQFITIEGRLEAEKQAAVQEVSVPLPPILPTPSIPVPGPRSLTGKLLFICAIAATVISLTTSFLRRA